MPSIEAIADVRGEWVRTPMPVWTLSLLVPVLQLYRPSIPASEDTAATVNRQREGEQIAEQGTVRFRREVPVIVHFEIPKGICTVPVPASHTKTGCSIQSDIRDQHPALLQFSTPDTNPGDEEAPSSPQFVPFEVFCPSIQKSPKEPAVLRSDLETSLAAAELCCPCACYLRCRAHSIGTSLHWNPKSD